MSIICTHYLISCNNDPLRTGALSSKVLASGLLDAERTMSYTSIHVRSIAKQVRSPSIKESDVFFSDLERSQLGSLFSPELPGNEADGTKVQIFPVQRKHVNRSSCLNV